MRATGNTLDISISENNELLESLPNLPVKTGTQAARLEMNRAYDLLVEIKNQRGFVIFDHRQDIEPILTNVATVSIDELLPKKEERHMIAEFEVSEVPIDGEACFRIEPENSPLNGMCISIPPGSIEPDITVVVEEVYNLGVQLEDSRPTSPFPEHPRQAGPFFEIKFSNSTLVREPLGIQIPYIPEQLNNLDLPVNELRLYDLREELNRWIPRISMTNGDNILAAQSESSPNEEIDSLGPFVLGGLFTATTPTPPTVEDDMLHTFVNTPVAFMLEATDADNDIITFEIEERPDHGTLDVAVNTYIYTPADNFAGADSLSFKAIDIGGLESNTANLSIDVRRHNPSLPVLPSQSRQSTPVSIAVEDVDGMRGPDIITANNSDHTVTVFFNDGMGSFTTFVRFETGDSPVAVVAVPLRSSGPIDLVTVDRGDDMVTVLLGQGNGNFNPRMNFSANSLPNAVAVKNIEMDNTIPDLVVTNLNNSVSVLLGNGDGTFNSPSPISINQRPAAVAVEDVDLDMHQDIITAGRGNDNSDTVLVLFGQGDGNFELTNSFPMGADPMSLEVADINDDGLPDLLTANQASDNVSVRTGLGMRDFNPEQHFMVGDGPKSVIVVDVNRDGYIDLITANENPNQASDREFPTDTISVLLGHPEKLFLADRRFIVGQFPVSVAVEDVGDNDNDIPDLLVANRLSNNVTVLLGRGDGNFPGDLGFTTGGEAPYATAVADVTRNGHLDIITAHVDSNNISILEGQGNGHFAQPRILPTNVSHRAIVVEDINDDTRPDIITANDNDSTICVLLSQDGGGFPAMCSFLPTGDRPQAIILINIVGAGDTPDIITANEGSDDITILMGTGNGDFDPPMSLPTGDNPQDLAVDDVNDDGFLDIITANAGTNDVTVLLSLGNDEFAEPRSFPTGEAPRAIAVADVIGSDSIPDIITANSVSNTVAILPGQGNGIFGEPISLLANVSPRAIEILDVNGDTFLDILVVNEKSHDIVFLYGMSDDMFERQPPIPVGLGPVSLNVVDVDGDGPIELITTNMRSHSVSVVTRQADGTFPR